MKLCKWEVVKCLVKRVITIINVKDLLAGSGVNVNNFSDFVLIRESNGNTIISVDQDGSSTFMPAQDIVTLTGVTNLSMDQIMII